MSGQTALPERRALRVRGVVQGVGFRPFVFRLAGELGLSGLVGNDPSGVFIEVEGAPSALAAFERRLRSEAPTLARVDAISARRAAPIGEGGFRIVESRHERTGRTFVPPDAATCAACLEELFDPADRRYRYPFTNCTNCGPRFTIILGLPYDRPKTTMRGFRLCAECAAEYGDPADRRFHAEPLACPRCGPRLSFEGAGRTASSSDQAIAHALAAIARGEIVAVKGIGGYHLACDATSDEAVQRLRARKGREGKPFAVMAPDLAAARQLADLDDAEAAVLAGAVRPILLATPTRRSPLAPAVAPRSPRIGVFLPYSPLHHLLFQPVPGSSAPPPQFLVLTSGNLSDEPICFEDEEARARLSGVADAFLVHDRPIHVPCDDSVVEVDDGEEVAIRRSRGYAPLPIRLPFDVPPLLATGAEMKNTFCLASGREAWLSQHLGEMGSVESLGGFSHALRELGAVLEIAPEVVVTDPHPRYELHRLAEALSPRPLLVQHHHAHVASVMAEHALPVGAAVIGLAFDGTGFGSDGTIWGGEVLLATYGAAERLGHLREILVPGGDGLVRHPYRAALAHLYAAGIEFAEDLEPVRAASSRELALLKRQLETATNCLRTTSAGRLFDAVASLLGLCQHASFEAEAAVALEALAASAAEDGERYVFGDDGGVLDPAPLLAALVADRRAGRAAASCAAGFHVALARAIANAAASHGERLGLRQVVLAGGVFQNRLLRRLVTDELAAAGLSVLTARRVPPNDGGISLGQAVAAGARLAARPVATGGPWA